MPASNNYTLIKLMRGDIAESDAWRPEIGEPLLDTESGTLRFGEKTGKMGGVPVNSMTTRELPAPVNLDRVIVWGRYYINGEIFSLPSTIESPSKLILEVQSSDLVQDEIIQTIQILDTEKPAETYKRISLDGGSTWTSWDGTSGINIIFDPSISNPNKYLNPGYYYIEDIVNGPMNVSGCDAFLFVYRQNVSSPYIYQFAYLTKCTDNDGKLFVRYSRDGGKTWVSSIYSGWYELTDFLDKMLKNPTEILKWEHGGTYRDDGTVWQADEALKTYYDVSPCKSNCITQSTVCVDISQLIKCPTDYTPKCPMDGAVEPPKSCPTEGMCSDVVPTPCTDYVPEIKIPTVKVSNPGNDSSGNMYATVTASNTGSNFVRLECSFSPSTAPTQKYSGGTSHKFTATYNGTPTNGASVTITGYAIYTDATGSEKYVSDSITYKLTGISADQPLYPVGPIDGVPPPGYTAYPNDRNPIIFAKMTINRPESKSTCDVIQSFSLPYHYGNMSGADSGDVEYYTENSYLNIDQFYGFYAPTKTNYNVPFSSLKESNGSLLSPNFKKINISQTNDYLVSSYYIGGYAKLGDGSYAGTRYTGSNHFLYHNIASAYPIYESGYQIYLPGSGGSGDYNNSLLIVSSSWVDKTSSAGEELLSIYKFNVSNGMVLKVHSISDSSNNISDSCCCRVIALQELRMKAT